MTVPRRILILFAHPALRKSRLNRRLAAAAQSVEGVRVRDLYEEYPDFMIHVKREQELLEAHDVILLMAMLPAGTCCTWDTQSLAKEVRGEGA